MQSLQTAKTEERRGFLRWGLVSAFGVLGLARTENSRAATVAPVCAGTIEQPEGPFYPGEANIVNDNDLTRVAGARKSAEGEVIYVRGRVTDLQRRPVAGVNVEIWQACASGRYNHAGDPNPAPLDPHFRYWGETFTDANGDYEFKTIKPGAYPASEDWDRPPHIHFRVAKTGYAELITQMYFQGETLNLDDLILQRVPECLRSNVIVDFQRHPENALEKVGWFDISIEKLV